MWVVVALRECVVVRARDSVGVGEAENDRDRRSVALPLYDRERDGLPEAVRVGDLEPEAEPLGRAVPLGEKDAVRRRWV